jgi:hypothetical protein
LSSRLYKYLSFSFTIDLLSSPQNHKIPKHLTHTTKQYKTKPSPHTQTINMAGKVGVGGCIVQKVGVGGCVVQRNPGVGGCVVQSENSKVGVGGCVVQRNPGVGGCVVQSENNKVGVGGCCIQ